MSMRPNFYLGPYVVTDEFSRFQRDETYEELNGNILPVSMMGGQIANCEIWIPNCCRNDIGALIFDFMPDAVGTEITAEKIARQIARFKERFGYELTHLNKISKLFNVTFGLVAYIN